MTSSIERAPTYRFAGFEVDVGAHELRGQGARIRLQDQPFQILVFLLERAGKVVTRDELRQRVWPSSVFVDFDHGLNNAIARLRESLGDAAGAPRFIETIPRIGYRFVATVTAEADSQPAGAAIGTATAGSSANRGLVVATAVGAVVLVAALLYFGIANWPSDLNPSTKPSALGPSIAVLPFVSLGPEAEDEHFADGLTEELVTKLAGIRGLKVVARTSSYRFKDTKESAKSIADALQISHFLEGSVQRSGQRLRITAQLVDARKDEHVWSQTFDRDIGDIFKIQEEIAFNVAAALKVALLNADEFRIRKHGTEDPEAYRLYLIAQAHLLRRTKNADINVAKSLLDAAIKRDPNFASAYAGLARYHFLRAWSTLIDTEESSRLGEAAAKHAVELDPDSSDAYVARANFEFWRYRFLGDYGAQIAAEDDMRHAIELDPANSAAFEDFGRAIFWHAPDVAADLLERAVQVDLLCTGPNIMIASLDGNRGQLESARKRCADLLARSPDAKACEMAIATLDSYYGHLDRAVPLLRRVAKPIGGAARIQLWSIYMSMGDRASAGQWLDFGSLPMEKVLSDAARFAMDGRYEQAFAILDRHRKDFAYSRLLDLPAEKFALLAGKPRDSLRILEQRVPDLASGVEPISARNVLPALDIATARMNVGAVDDAQSLVRRVAKYLDDSPWLRLPLFAVQRARAYALAGETDAAFRALDQAFEQGQRTTWALDLRPQSFLYVDPLEADPAFTMLRADPRFGRWLDRIHSDNQLQLKQLNAAQPET